MRMTEVAGEVERLRTIYAGAGYGHGHRAGLLLFNRPEFLFHWLALNALGVSVVPVNPEWRSDELAYLVGHSEISLAVAPVDRHASLATAAASANRPLALAAPDGIRHRGFNERRAVLELRRRPWHRSARCSTPRARPAAPRAASCRTSIFSGQGTGTPVSTACARSGRAPSG